MSGLWRARIGSFLAGSGVTAIAAFAVLRQDLAASFKGLSDKVSSTGFPVCMYLHIFSLLSCLL